MRSTTTRPRVGRPRASRQVEPDLGPRDQILDAAAALFAERGYAGTSTRAIAERVGVRQASLYHHFSGKDELLLELLETSVRPSLAFLEDLLGHPDPAAALYALARIDVATLLATRHNIGTLYLAHEVQQPVFDSFRAHRATLQAAYARLGAALGADDPSFIGGCCMQLVEMVIVIRRDAEPGSSAGLRTGHDIATACLRVPGLPATQVRRASSAGAVLVSRLAPRSSGADVRQRSGMPRAGGRR